MNRENMLKQLADDGYNIGFGSCKSFATYDIANMWMRVMALISLLVGVAQISTNNIQVNNRISLILIFAGILALHIACFIPDKEKYNQVGKRQLEIYYELRDLYRKVKSMEEGDFSKIDQQRQNMYAEFSSISISNEIFLLSDIYAHIKFFGQKQVDWIDEQKQFKFWRDKFPNSVKAFTLVLIVFCFVLYYLLFIL